MWAPHGVMASFRHPPAPAWGPFHRLQVEICSTMDLHGLQRDNLPHHGSSSRAAREDSLLWPLEHLLPPPSSLTLVSAELFLLHCLTPLSSLMFHHSFFLPLLKSLITEALPLLLTVLALASGGSVLEPSGIGFIRHGEASHSFSWKPHLQPPHYQNLATQTHNTRKGLKLGILDRIGNGFLVFRCDPP